jgi:5-methylcytosine-specific restriction enzyme subunit McrC
VRLITLREYETRVCEATSPAIRRALTETKLVTASPTFDGQLRLKAKSRIGAVRVSAGGETVELRVLPKLLIARLFWLLGYARDPAGWREEPVGLSEAEDLVPAIAFAFCATTTKAFAPGILHGYRAAEEALPLLRGRVRESDQLNRQLGAAVPVEVRYDDYTPDITENRILLSAAQRLLRLPGVAPSSRTALLRLTAALSGVTPLPPRAPVPATRPDRLTNRYQPALRLARLILAGDSIEHPAGQVEAIGFVFDLNQVFEDWLTTALRVEIESRHGGRVSGQHSMNLDQGRRLPAVRPDITWWNGNRCAAVLDAKYKTIHATPPRDDVYQMLAYCSALGLRRGHLVYASIASGPTEFRLTGSGVRIHAHSLDLAAPLPKLRAQITTLADAMTR